MTNSAIFAAISHDLPLTRTSTNMSTTPKKRQSDSLPIGHNDMSLEGREGKNLVIGTSGAHRS